MAKRKRKMTLFDVMENSRSTGVNVRDRSATHRAESLRTSRSLRDAALSRGASSATPARGAPQSASDELAAMRREMGASPVEREAGLDPHRAELQARAIPLEPAPETPVVKVRPPRKPRKPVGEVARETWAVVAPHLNRTADVTGNTLRAVGRGTSSVAVASWQQAQRVRDVDTRYLLTAGVAVGAIVLLSGAFVVGRMLSQRTTPDVIADGTRPDVLDLSPAGSGSAMGSLANRPVETRLERSPVPTVPQRTASSAFGGRDLALNYVILASSETTVDAEAIVDVLNKHGVKASVEKNLPVWHKAGRDAHYVVSSSGFTGPSDPTYARFVDKVNAVSARETGANLASRLGVSLYKFPQSAAQR